MSSSCSCYPNSTPILLYHLLHLWVSSALLFTEHHKLLSILLLATILWPQTIISLLILLPPSENSTMTTTSHTHPVTSYHIQYSGEPLSNSIKVWFALQLILCFSHPIHNFYFCTIHVPAFVFIQFSPSLESRNQIFSNCILNSILPTMPQYGLSLFVVHEPYGLLVLHHRGETLGINTFPIRSTCVFLSLTCSIYTICINKLDNRGL